MRTVRRLVYREVLTAVGFTTLAFLALMFFFDFVDQLGRIGRPGYTLSAALLSTALELPSRFYELFPITVLIGSIYALSRLAQSSEFTILRTAGLGPGRALGMLTALGLVFALLTLLVGDLLAPAAEQKNVSLKAAASGSLSVGPAGAWLRDRVEGPQGGQPRSVSVHVARLGARGDLQGVRIYEFDPEGRLQQRIEAQRAVVDEEGRWQLSEVRVDTWGEGEGLVRVGQVPSMQWSGNLKASVVSAAVLPVGTMTTLELWRYSRHLSRQDQAFAQHAIAFWKKALYPMACFVMLGLALPFAYLHARGGGISWKVFGGIMIGISFMVFNSLSSHLGLLQGWSPWVAAAAPGFVYLMLSLAAFGWLVRYR
ncbi:MAG: LPS export ABC transporter permease LptG [Betaproteobacteria bacterium]|jgi:lipopolysaccharide export system permease protein|nr:LPS export ABC transporter permease LptG [Betaproteobacteria bacterium]